MDRFFLKYTGEDELYVGLDAHSGGYPFATSFVSEIHFFPSAEEAKKYSAHWPGKFTIHELLSLNSVAVD